MPISGIDEGAARSEYLVRCDGPDIFFSWEILYEITKRRRQGRLLNARSCRPMNPKTTPVIRPSHARKANEMEECFMTHCGVHLNDKYYYFSGAPRLSTVSS